MDGTSPTMSLVSGQDEVPDPPATGSAHEPAAAPPPLLRRLDVLEGEMDALIERMDEMEARFHRLDALNAYAEESSAFRMDQSRHLTHRDS